jgi:hypothetical protein
MTRPITHQHLQTDIAELLRQARTAAVRSVNAIMTASHWEVGRRMVEAEQKGKRRAAYGFSDTRPLKYGGLAALALTLLNGVLSWAGQCGFSGGAGWTLVLRNLFKLR